MEVLNVAEAPDPTDEQLWVSAYGRRVDDYAVDTEICKRGLIHVVFLIERDTDLVNDPVPAALLDFRLYKLRLITVYVVLREDLPDCLNTRLDRRFVVGCKAIREEKYKEVADAAKSFVNGYAG